MGGYMFAQDSTATKDTTTSKIEINGSLLTQIITDTDTILAYALDNINVSTPRTFESNEEYNRYRRYRQYANKVYPYALESIKLFREMEAATADLKKRKRKKHIRQLRKDVKDEFSDPLKNLSRTQGKILVKMIERELDRPMFDLLKELNGGLAASKWQFVGKLYGYDLKEGYIECQDKILDAVLQDFDISYEIK